MGKIRIKKPKYQIGDSVKVKWENPDLGDDEGVIVAIGIDRGTTDKYQYEIVEIAPNGEHFSGYIDGITEDMISLS